MVVPSKLLVRIDRQHVHLGRNNLFYRGFRITDLLTNQFGRRSLTVLREISGRDRRCIAEERLMNIDGMKKTL